MNQPSAPATLADALKSLKQRVARRLVGDENHFWQKRYYDFNVRNEAQFVEKLHYIHSNPVNAGIVRPPRGVAVEQLSPSCDWLRGADRNRVRMDRAKTRTSCWKPLCSRRTAPLKPKAGLNGPPGNSTKTRSTETNTTDREGHEFTRATSLEESIRL